MTNIPISRAAWSADVDRIRDITARTPALPEPTIAPARATFDYRHLAEAGIARASVAWAGAALAAEFGVTFTERAETAGDDTPRWLLEAKRPGRLTLVIISRVQLDQGQDARDEAGELVAA